MRRWWLVLGLVAAFEPAWARCPDFTRPAQLRALEPAAGRGALSREEVDCLEDAFARTGRQTTKNKISRVLLVHAYVTDTTWWAELVRRHLSEVDQSDPDMAFLYAIHLHVGGEAEPEEVVRWAEVALERRHVWTGEAFVVRSLSLLRLRAYAAARQWQRLAESGTGDEIDEETGRSPVETLRNTTKTYAREWLDFAASAGKDTTEAGELCRSAATKESACALR